GLGASFSSSLGLSPLGSSVCGVLGASALGGDEGVSPSPSAEGGGGGFGEGRFPLKSRGGGVEVVVVTTLGKEVSTSEILEIPPSGVITRGSPSRRTMSFSAPFTRVATKSDKAGGAEKPSTGGTGMGGGEDRACGTGAGLEAGSL